MISIYEHSKEIGWLINALCDQCLFAGAIEGVAQMKLPAAAYSAEVATSAEWAAAGYLAKFFEATTLLRQGYGEFSPPSSP